MTEMPIIVIKDLHPIEISAEEWEMIMRVRERQRKKVRQSELVAELNDLLARIKDEGFTVSTSKVNSLTKAEPWGDSDGSWIRVR